MTVRRKAKSRITPEQVAALVPPEALAEFPPEDYREYFYRLTDEVAEISGVHDSLLTSRVAQGLGVSVVDWYKAKLTRRVSSPALTLSEQVRYGGHVPYRHSTCSTCST